MITDYVVDSAAGDYAIVVDDEPAPADDHPHVWFLPREIIDAIDHDRQHNPVLLHDSPIYVSLAVACWRFCFGEYPSACNFTRAGSALHYYRGPAKAGALFVKRKEPNT